MCVSLDERTLCLHPGRLPYLELYIQLITCLSENLDQEAWYSMKYHDVYLFKDKQKTLPCQFSPPFGLGSHRYRCIHSDCGCFLIAIRHAPSCCSLDQGNT